MDELMKHNENNLELEKALEHITQHVVNKNFYYKNAYSMTKNPDITENYENQNQRRSYFLESMFNNCNLKGSGFTDSIFNQVEFNNCNFDDSNFESCYMFDCHFKNIKPYTSTSFAKSFLYNSTFKEIEFNRCRLSDMRFINSLLEGCHFDNSSLDGTIFTNTILDEVSFKNLNLEYVQFDDIHINNTSLPFPTIPYIINGIQYLKTTTDNVYIKSAKQGRLTKEEYIDILPHLKTYYECNNNFFPLANIFIAENDFNKAFEYIKLGMCQSIFLNNYRQLKNYCILVSSCNLFDIHQRKLFASILSKELNNRLMENFKFYAPLSRNLTELNSILLSSSGASLIITFKTNIKNDNYSVLSLFYKTIDMLVGIVGIESNYSVNFTYNSEAEIITTINSLDTTIIVALITAFTTLFMSGIKGLAQLPDVINSFAVIKQKIQQEKLESERKRLENQKLQLEITKMQKEIDNISPQSEVYFDKMISGITPILSNCDELKNAKVHIDNINYNAINVDVDSLTKITSNIIYKNITIKD